MAVAAPYVPGQRHSFMVSNERFEIDARYTPISPLGSGAFGVVCACHDSVTGAKVAVKKVKNAFSDARDAKMLLREIKLLRHLQHENIIPLIDIQPPASPEQFDDVYHVTEMMDCDLHRINYSQKLTDDHVQCFIYQIFKALKYIHSAGLVHRDLKPSNLLLNEECLVKVADFGLARSMKVLRKADEEASVLTDYVATRWYRAPEIILGSTCYTKSVDMWAMGCIIAEMFVGKPLIAGTSTMNQLEKIVELVGFPDKESIEKVQSNFAPTMMQSLNQQGAPGDLTDRLNKAACASEAVELCVKLLYFAPDKRPTVVEAIKDAYMRQFYTGQEENAPDLLTIPIDDDVKFSVSEYRERLYQTIQSVKKDRSLRMSTYFSRRG